MSYENYDKESEVVFLKNWTYFQIFGLLGCFNSMGGFINALVIKLIPWESCDTLMNLDVMLI